MASVLVTETGLQIQVNLYRNMNGSSEGGTIVTISAWSITDRDEIPGRTSFDLDVTSLLSPQQLNTAKAMLDVAEAFQKNRWQIP